MLLIPTISERQLKTIQDNIDLLKLNKQLAKLGDDIKSLQSELDAMGVDKAREKFREAQAVTRSHQVTIERHNGRMQGLVEQKRNLKRKLAEPEYKGVDERYRMKMIEHETTNIVVTDLDKYYDALDKALLRYHGMKIGDINKIIRELWALTYKGEGMLLFDCTLTSGQRFLRSAECMCNQPLIIYLYLHSLSFIVDITNIEIQSGQDTASRANRSYNYRIVMSKGNTQMDMRGRCSAVSYL